MKYFIELTVIEDKVLGNCNNITAVDAQGDVTRISFIGDESKYIYVSESYEQVKALINRIEIG